MWIMPANVTLDVYILEGQQIQAHSVTKGFVHWSLRLPL